MTTLCFRGPDIAIVGWIPYFGALADLPAGHNYKTSLAMHLLFNSGNDEPPTEFSGGYEEFADWLKSRKDYRGALYLHDVILRYEEDKPAPIISYQVEGIMGYTPIQLKLGIFKGAIRLKGQSPNDYPEPLTQALPENRGVTISFRYCFKLSPIVDIMQRAITGRWAPNAWGAIDYEISKSGRVRINTSGTAIPTQDIYVDWKRVDNYRHDMLANSSQNIRGFLNDTPGCADAPPGTRQSVWEAASTC